MEIEVQTEYNFTKLVNALDVRNSIYGSLLILISAFILASNGLLICVIYSSKYLHRCQNAFVMCLAIGDILNGFVEGPFLAHIVLNRPEQVPPQACPFVLFINYSTKATTSFSLMMLSIERCLAVSKPLKYARLVTIRSCTISVVLICVFSVLISSLPLLRERFIYDKFKCRFEGDTTMHTKIFIITYMGLSRMLPMLVIWICIATILYNARTRFKCSSMIAAVPFTVTPVAYPLNLRKITLKALRSLLYLTITFSVLTIICCSSGIPRTIRNFEFPPGYEMALEFTSLSHYFITPVMILIFNKQYQNRIVSLCCTRCGKKNRVGQDQYP
ncbi:pyroglutamylated RF-amide peptide receptor-like [Ostrea edulis]|uniref:pyroglutamylated RF-amide peptide receptor-like n=1 Tax=Ostrea edulis TaxID=37623 RepID=UPI0024AF7E9A|nr:pyroglutamylated RF-amide peptide receptor-like [Ostrea edulis]